MNELRIIRGTDVKLYADDTPLFGITELSAVQKKSYYDVCEYLSGVPCEHIPQGAHYEIKLSFMALFDGQLPAGNVFSLRVTDGSTEYRFDNCRVTEQKTELKGNAKAVDVISLKADRMRKAVINDE